MNAINSINNIFNAKFTENYAEPKKRLALITLENILTEYVHSEYQEYTTSEKIGEISSLCTRIDDLSKEDIIMGLNNILTQLKEEEVKEGRCPDCGGELAPGGYVNYSAECHGMKSWREPSYIFCENCGNRF